MSASEPIGPSICLVRLSALGDVVLVLPLVRRLQTALPGLRLTWIIGRGAHQAVAGLANEGVEFVVIDKPRGPRDYLALRRQLAHRRFDALLCLQASWRANWIYPCIRARRKIGYGSDRARDLHRFFVRETLPPAAPHLVDGFLQFADKLGVGKSAETEWRLPVAEDARLWAAAQIPSGDFLALSPCASKEERDWPIERHLELVRLSFARHGLPFVLLGGNAPREHAVAERLQQEAGVPMVRLTGKTNIPQLLAVLERARALISPDTGAVHIARALGRPVVGLYAVAPASRTGPYGQTHFCVDVFDQALREILHKDPASCPWNQRVHSPDAMRLIQVEAVCARLDAVLA